MDLSLFKVKDSIQVEISHPDLDGEITFEMAGPSHPRTIQGQRDLQDRMASSKKRKLDAKEMNALGNELLASRVLSWKGVEWNGEPLECTKEAALQILSNPDLGFIAEQISRAMGDTESFFGK